MSIITANIRSAFTAYVDDPLRWPLWRRLALHKLGLYTPGGPFRPYAAEVFPPKGHNVEITPWLRWFIKGGPV